MNQEKKEPSVRSKSRKETKSRRKSMVIKVLSFNIQKNKLSKSKKSYLNLLRIEAKYYYNYLIYLSEQSITDDFGNIVYPNNLFDFNTKSDWIKIYDRSTNSYYDYELKVLSSQVKQELLKKIQSSIKAISAAKSKGRKTGKLKFKSLVNIPLKQFNNSFYLSDNCKKLSIQGNKKQAFHLIRNRNLSKLCKELNLDNNGNVSLKKLIDLKIIEIANAEIVFDFNDKYSFNLTVYFNPEYLIKANLFQGTKLSQKDLELIQSTKIGNDAGISSEITVNCEETYASISIDSRKPVNKYQARKLARLRNYQKQFNRHISKSKKAKAHGKLIRNNSTNGFRTNKYYKLKNSIDKIQSNINNHKTDSIAKLISIFDLFKGITFQNEMVKSWHSNKKMRFSNAIQKGILGKTYAKLKHKYDDEDNKVNYKHKKLSKSLRTTKTCVCGIVNKNIILKDRVYYCSQCGYENDRDTHSSYIINHTLNHENFDYMEYQQNAAMDCGIQSKDWDEKQLILSSNLGQITTSVKTKLIFDILSSKLKSQNLSLKFNYYLGNRANQEASSFKTM